MARRSDHNREQLYDMALQAARDIVVRDGYRSLTARNVADAIGYSPGTLYNLFANLDDMILHLNASTLDALYDSLTASPMSGDAVDDLKSLASLYLDFVDTNERLWALLFDHLLPEGQTLPDWYLKKVDKLLGLVETAMTPLFPSKDDPRCGEAARVLWASMHGIFSLAGSGKLAVVSRDPVQHMADHLIDTYIRGLRC